MTLIKGTLELIRDRLNEYLKTAVPRKEDWVSLSNVLDNEGRAYDGARNKIVMFLSNIQNETIISTYNSTVPAKDNQYTIVTPPIYIDLYLLFYANFSDKQYSQGLGMISWTISFFQQNPWFTHQNLPGLDPEIDKLTFEIMSLDITDLNYLMGLMGVKYLPSVYYKVRMIPFRSDAIKGTVPAAQGVQTPGQPRDSHE